MNDNALGMIFLSVEKSMDMTNDLETLNNLKTITGMLQSTDWRLSLDERHWQTFTKLARRGLEILTKENIELEEIHFLAELLRCLRNSCASACNNQQFVIKIPDVYSFVNKSFWKVLLRQDIPEEEVKILRCCLQLFGNLVSQGSIPIKTAVWNTFLEKGAVRLLLQHSGLRVREYTMMVLYNCVTDESTDHILNSSSGHDILAMITDSLDVDIIDWAMLFLEAMLKREDFMEKCYSSLPIKNRFLILDVIAELLDAAQEDIIFQVPKASIQFVKSIFVEMVMDVVQICNSEAVDLKIIEIVKMLSVLCAASVLEQYSEDLNTNRELMEILIDTLKSVHLLGKKSCNAFSCISSLSEKASISKEEIESIPSYEFKKNLIRLIGNLCYNSKENQDQVRKLDGIPLLLDCCNLDARNPFIMQWCILAIRNILEKNMENQEVLASISVTGDLTESNLLKELGFAVESRNGKFVLTSTQNPY